MLNVCNDGHEEIVFDGRPSACPLCDALKANQNLTEDIEAANETIATLRESLEAAEERHG